MTAVSPWRVRVSGHTVGSGSTAQEADRMNETSSEHTAGSSEHRPIPRRVARVVVGAFVVVAGTLGVQAVAVAQQASIKVSPSSAAPGDTVTLSGNHPIAGDCAPGAARLTS